jgi:hypothetical protein
MESSIMKLVKLMLLASCATPSVAWAGDPPAAAASSRISVPVRINLSTAEDALNAAVPQRLVQINENNRVCIPAKRVKYKYPCFRGWKWYSCDGWTKGTPEIKCDVDGWVDRNGPIQLTGQGDSLRIEVPIRAKVSAKAAGVSETAEAAVRIGVTATPTLTPDWKVRASLHPDLSWDKKPTLRLFNLVDVTITSHVEPRLREELHSLLSEASDVIGKLDVRSPAAGAWLAMQQPIALSTAPPSYLQVDPVSIGYSGLSTKDDVLQATVSLAARTAVHLGTPPAAGEPTPLPDVSLGETTPSGFHFVVPLALPYAELLAAANLKFPEGYHTTIDDGPVRGDLELSTPRLSSPADGSLRMEIDAKFDDRGRFVRTIDLFDWFDTEGTFQFVVEPYLDADRHTLGVRDLRLASDTDNELVDTLVQIANLPAIRARIAAMATYSYADEVGAALTAANGAIASHELPGIRLTGGVESGGVRSLKVLRDRLVLDLAAEGQLQVEVQDVPLDDVRLGMGNR